uniref:Tubulin-specific chaperone D n=1 Tax=Chlamydomonas leiostraca TaxID=1034604 RepID=A0A7S0WWR5_9CHLO
MVPALGSRLAALGPHERELLPVFECLTSLAIAAGRHIDTYAPALFDAALRCVTTQLQLRADPSSGGGRHEYDREIHVCALDLVSGLAEGLGASLDPLVGPSQLMQVVVAACCDEAADVRQSGFALVGDLSRGCVSHVAPRAQDVVGAALACLAPELLTAQRAEGTGTIMKAANNACWAVGEMALKLPPGSTTAWAEPLAERLTVILTTGPSRLPRSLIDNAAITMGRLAASAPQQLAQHLPHFCMPWCQGLRNIRDDVEKETAFTGLCAVLRLNPAPAMPPAPAWAALASAIASWRSVANASLRAEMAAVMQAYKQSLTAQGTWQQALGALEGPLAQKLCSMCDL